MELKHTHAEYDTRIRHTHTRIRQIFFLEIYIINIYMANFTCETFKAYDDYMTPKSAWDNIQNLIPRDKILWEAFYGDGSSGTHLKDLGFDTVHEPVDFFENDFGDIIVSNPPFTKIKEVLQRLLVLNKPFILIMPSSKINTQYFRSMFKNTKIQIIIPPKRIQFIKLPFDPKNSLSCNFDCFYYCYQMELENDITWI
jgi:hypothetical protein